MIPVTKDEHAQASVPDAWRPTLRKVVQAFVRQDWALIRSIPRVTWSTDPEWSASYVQKFGQTLIELPDETWQTSCCQWQIGFWEVLVDLYTREAGRSDLVLQLKVREDGSGRFHYMLTKIYVP